jgi:hypothetical protein
VKQFRVAIVLGTIIATAFIWSATPAGADAPSREPGGASIGGVTPGVPYPAGVACPFPVSFDLVGGGEGQLFTFFDHNGDPIRLMNHARPSTWVFTNLDTGASYTLALPAGLTRIRPSADGTTTVELSGGIIGFNAPTDTPPGPFALAITGRIIFVVAPDGTGTLAKVSGTTVDLCAAVS